MTETPPTLSKVKSPKKLTGEQRRIVGKLIKHRYAILNNVVQNAPSPPTVTLTPNMVGYGWAKFINMPPDDSEVEQGDKPIPADLRKLWDAAVKACQAHDKLREKYDKQNNDVVRAHNERRNTLRSKLYREEQGTQATLLLDDAADEVRQYLGELPSLDGIMDELKALGMTPERANQILITSEVK